MDRYEDILNAILVDGGRETLRSPATRAEVFQSALFTKSRLIDPVTSQLDAIANDVGELQNTGVDTTARADIAEIESQLSDPIRPSKLYGYAAGKNMFNKNAVVAEYVSSSTGAIRQESGFYCSEYIPVLPSTAYYKKGTYGAAYYTSGKVFISGTSGHALSTPSNCAFVRINVYGTVFNGVAGLDGEQLTLGAIDTEYEEFTFTVTALRAMTPTPALAMNLPPKIYALVGQQLNIYFDNIINDRDAKYDFRVSCTVGKQFERFYRVTPFAAGSYALKIEVLKDDVVVSTGITTLLAYGATVGNGANKKVIIIGDSTTDNDYLVPHLTGDFTEDVMDITMLGTQGTSPNRHEGQAGWETNHFVTVGSPFWDGSAFNFSQYMANQGYASVDYVVINLGINDVFYNETDATVFAKTATVLGQYQSMITSMHAFDPNIKIGIACTIPPAYSQDDWGNASSTGKTMRRYKRNNFLFVQQLIATFASRESEKIYIIPIHASIDTRYNFTQATEYANARNTTNSIITVGSGGAVHPAESGYWQMADIYWFFLKSFES